MADLQHGREVKRLKKLLCDLDASSQIALADQLCADLINFGARILKNRLDVKPALRLSVF